MKETVCETLETYAVPVYSRQFVREDLGKLAHFNISCALLWETLILQLRTRTISYSIARHRNNKQRELDMLRENHELEEEFDRDPQSEVKQERLEMKKKEFEEIFSEKMDGIIIRSRCQWYEKGERSNRFFLGLEKRNYLSRLVSCLKVEGKAVYKQEEIMNCLVQHYREVFCRRDNIPFNTDTYLHCSDKNVLSEQEKNYLERPI